MRHVSPDLDSHQGYPLSNSAMKFSSGASQALANDVENFPPRIPSQFQGPKRNRSPPLESFGASFSVSPSTELDSEREIKAKAKRLARFHAELSQPEEKMPEFSRKVPRSKTSPIEARAMKFSAEATKKADLLSDGLFPDSEGMESYAPIRGACPDMCPESERGERERKGDLDRYERLDGERNQTSISLAVKKYTRTAERDAKLIRPLPVLRRTVDYLLNLLNHPYDDQLLGLYNFLWDRMRAVRLDLRMQHIFNRDAIEMLEKMIRLHIIAMHELCEYNKGEGFTEGFDAHLNIEQMNKTSVELFQMYDDHRKRGSIIPTEKEFRGYYALLKLDKHPGYKVEPAELSLDLASMSPDIRHSPEIVFARDVARACRTGNFIAFFRLARKATYLQACLMHAHFSKLRSQALASLHSGLQNNQGVPVEHVVIWLAIEGEDIDSLLEYYGFSIKRFEEPYMVKGGPFLNSDLDYATKCSQLVKLKRANAIVENVCRSLDLVVPDKPSSSVLDGSRTQEIEVHAIQAIIDAADDNMSDLTTSDHGSKEETEPEMMPAELLLPGSSKSVVEIEMDGDDDVHVVQEERHHDESLLLNPSRESTFNETFSPRSIGMHVQIDEQARPEVELRTDECTLDDQVAESMKYEEDIARLRRILRRWKRRSSRKREMRVRRQSLAYAALNSLSLGPPLRQADMERFPSSNLNIADVARERYHNYKKSWARLNISDVIAPTLSARNPRAKCLVWKLAVCLQTNYGVEDKDELMLSSWLLWKLMGSSQGEEDDGRVLSSLRLSIWKTTEIQTTSDYCCYSVVRDVGFLDSDAMGGLSAVMFLAYETIPWATQKDRLDKILDSIPSGSALPLVIFLSCSNSDRLAGVNRGLWLEHLSSRTAVSSCRVFLVDEKQLHDNDRLTSCLLWLAENSPLQPCIHEIMARDLVTGSLNASLANVNPFEASPEDCVDVFNKALDNSAEEILSAADSNKNGWPAPEIDLLPHRDSQIVAKSLPRVDWSASVRIQHLITSLKRCKLPSFSRDWQCLIRQGCEDLSDLVKQKVALEFCLFAYLHRSVGLASESLASLEARVMIQKMVFLECRSNRHFMVPEWAMIFRRIYNWRLQGLSSAVKSTSAYVLTDKGIHVLDMSKPKSLAGIGCLVRGVRLEELAIDTDDNALASPQSNDHQGIDHHVLGAGLHTSSPTSWKSRMDQNQEKVVGFADEEEKTMVDARLVDLLEKCDRLQDSIGRKLAVYF